jgi:hypothetical protein
MRDQKLGGWLGMLVELPDADTLKTNGLKPSVSVFAKNASQALALSAFPTQIALLGQKIKLAEINACTMLGIDNVIRGDVARSSEILVLSRDILSGRAQPPTSSFSYMFSITDFAFVDDNTRDTYDTLMSMQLVLSWTAFETLAGDLWEAALNTHHSTLLQKAPGDKPIKLKDLHLTYGYDLRHKMGSVLRDVLGNPFQSFRTMKQVYLDTFTEGNASAATFWDNKDVSSTFHLRNLTVHRAGIVDGQFLADCKADNRMQAYKRDERFYLDGHLLSELVRGLFTFARELIQSVDSWFQRHPGSSIT